MTDFKVGDIVRYHTAPLRKYNHFKDVVWIVTQTDIPGYMDGTVRIEPLFGDAKGVTHRHTDHQFVRRITDDNPEG